MTRSARVASTRAPQFTHIPYWAGTVRPRFPYSNADAHTLAEARDSNRDLAVASAPHGTYRSTSFSSSQDAYASNSTGPADVAGGADFVVARSHRSGALTDEQSRDMLEPPDPITAHGRPWRTREKRRCRGPRCGGRPLPCARARSRLWPLPIVAGWGENGELWARCYHNASCRRRLLVALDRGRLSPGITRNPPRL